MRLITLPALVRRICLGGFPEYTGIQFVARNLAAELFFAVQNTGGWNVSLGFPFLNRLGADSHQFAKSRLAPG